MESTEIRIKERRPSRSFASKIAKLKYSLKIAWKAVRKTKEQFPYKSVSFSELLLQEQSNKFPDVYNRFESLTYRLKISEASLIKYEGIKYSLQNILPVEGENKKAYRWPRKHVASSPEVYCYSLANGGLTGTEGLIYDTKSQRYIIESIKRWFTWDAGAPSFYIGGLHYKRPTFVSGVTLCISKPGSDSYFHFLHESLTIYLLLKQRFPQVKFDNLVINGEKSAFKEAWLRQGGVTVENIIYTDSHTHLICEQLVFVSDLCFQYAPNHLTQHLLKGLISQSVLQGPSTGSKLIIASRRNAGYRKIEWEEELAQTFGATLIYFENLLPEQAIKVCRDCDCFIGVHGAAFSNIVFCQPGTQVIEIAIDLDEILYRRLAGINGLKHVIFNHSQKKELFAFLNKAINE